MVQTHQSGRFPSISQDLHSIVQLGLKKGFTKNSMAMIIAFFLNRPICAKDLEQYLGISRFRAHGIFKLQVGRGYMRRVGKGERGRIYYELTSGGELRVKKRYLPLLGIELI